MMENVEEILPLSPVQSGMLYETISGQAAPGTYVAAVTMTLDGPLDPQRFEIAVNTALRSRDALRAAFIWEGVSQPVQLIAKSIELAITHLDWSQSTTQDADLEALIETERGASFDLKQAPLMRGTLIKLSENTHKFVWTAHHLIADGWSTGVIARDILAQYNDTQNTASKEADASYRTYLSWQKKRNKAPDLAFWSDYLEGLDGPTSIAFKPDQSPDENIPHQRVTNTFSDDLIAGIQATARNHRATVVSLLSTVWALTLRRYSGQSDVVFGQTNTGRPTAIKGINGAVGAFINTLPVRMKIDPAQTGSDLLARAEADAIARRAHQYAGLRDVLDGSDLPHGTQAFDTLFVFEDFPPLEPQNSGLSIIDITGQDASTYPLSILIYPGSTWRMEAIFDPQHLSQDLSENILHDYQSLLQQLVDAPEKSIADLTQDSWQAQATPQPKSTEFHGIVDQISKWATKTPDAHALTDANTTATYAQLDKQSDGIAAFLQQERIGRGDIVPIALERSADVVAAMLGVLKAGACYTPLDLDYPIERLAQTIDACAPKVIVTSTGAQSRLPEVEAALIYFDAAASPPDYAPVTIEPDDLAYIIFTSGSSGTPKGVMISHSNLAYSSQARDMVYPASPSAFLLMSSFAFDSSVVGIYWTLANGGNLVVSKPHAEQNMEALGQTIASHDISHLLCLPSLYQSILKAVPKDRLKSLTTAIVAGEAVLPSVLSTHQTTLPGANLFNEYGPTEATVWCAAADLTRHDPSDAIPIGTPPDDTNLEISDPDGHALPTGMIGEITIAGPGVAQGYLHNSEATQNAFPMGRYKTGDLGYKRSDGQTIFLGRQDDQIKIRGHRIELEDVQSNIAKITGISDLAVIATNTENTPQLACILATNPETFDARATKATVSAHLPAHMVPSSFMAVSELPRLPNGKTDTGTLSALIQNQTQYTLQKTQPASFTETKLVEVWKEVLGAQTVSPEDDFFDLGGDSLKTIAASLKAEELGLNIAPYELFEFPKLRDLAARLHTRAEALADTIPDANLAHANDAGTKPIFFMIHGSLKMYSYLSAALGTDRPLGFLFSHFFSGDIHPSDRIETLTDQAMDRLKSLKPNGPYHLGGYSLGGIIALELAHHLREQGETVETLFLLDPSYDVRNPEGSGPDKIGTKRHGLVENLGGGALMALAKLNAHLPGKDKNRARMDYVGSAYRRILTYYRPPIYDGETVIMTTPLPEEGHACSQWQKLALPNARREELPFGHFDLQREPDALMAWTSKLSAILKKSESN